MEQTEKSSKMKNLKPIISNELGLSTLIIRQRLSGEPSIYCLQKQLKYKEQVKSKTLGKDITNSRQSRFQERE